MSQFLKVKLKASAIARTQKQKDTLRGLGLRRLQQVRVLKNTLAIRGMVQKVIHLVEFEETDKADLSKPEKVLSYKIGAAAKKKKTTKKKATAKKETKSDQAEEKQKVESK